MLSAVTSDDDEDGDSTSRSDFGDVRPPSECVKHADCPKWTAPLLSSFCGYQPFEPDDRPTDGQLSHSELLELPKSIASLSTPDAIIELLGHQPLLEDSDNEVDSGDYSHSTLASDGGAVLGLPSDFGPSQTFRQFDFSGVGVGGMRHCEDIFLNAPLKQTCLQNDFAATDVSPLSHNQAYSPSRSSCRAMKTIRAKRLLVSRLSADANRSSGESNRCDSLPCVTPKVDCSDWPVEKVADHLQVICMSHENVTTELSVMESSTVASDSSTTTTDEETNFGGGSNRRNCRSEPLGKMSQSVRFRSRNVGGGRSSRRLDSGGEISGFIPTKKKTFNHRRSELASNDSAFINSSFQNEVEDQLVMVDTKKSS